MKNVVHKGDDNVILTMNSIKYCLSWLKTLGVRRKQCFKGIRQKFPTYIAKRRKEVLGKKPGINKKTWGGLNGTSSLITGK